MSKKLIIFLLFLLALVASPAWAQSTTPNLGLQLPAYQQQNWQVPINYDFTQLDTVLGGVQNLITGATPAISVGSNWQTENLSATTILNFSGGYPGQLIRVFCGTGDTFTTISNSANISVTAPWSCATFNSISFVLVGSVWKETGRSGGVVGSVVSVGLSMPSWFSVANSPVTTSGVLTVTAAGGQGSHLVIGTCGTATSFAPCSLVAGDIPPLAYLSSASGAANLVMATPNGASGSPFLRSLVGGDIPAINLAASGNGGVTGILGSANFGPLTGDVTTSGYAATLANSGVTAGTCGDTTHSCGLTLDAKGRATSRSNNAIAFPVTSVFSRTGAVVAAANDYSFSQISGTLGSGQFGPLTGDVTTSGYAATLANSGVTAGSCGDATHFCAITVDAKGRTTALANTLRTTGVVASVGGNGNTTVAGNTTAAQAIQSYTFPAGTLNTLGKAFRMTFSAIATNGIGVAETIGGGVEVGAGTFPLTSGVSVANTNQLQYTFELVCITQATGASGFLSCTYPTSQIYNATTYVTANTAAIFSLNPIDLTAAVTISPYVQFSGASTSNTGGLVQFMVEQLN